MVKAFFSGDWHIRKVLSAADLQKLKVRCTIWFTQLLNYLSRFMLYEILNLHIISNFQIKKHHRTSVVMRG